MPDITGDDLDAYRRRLGLGWEQFGQRMGMSKSTIYRLATSDAVLSELHVLALEAAAVRLAAERNDLGCLLAHQFVVVRELLRLARRNDQA